MLTNNYNEYWHNQLRTCFFQEGQETNDWISSPLLSE